MTADAATEYAAGEVARRGPAPVPRWQIVRLVTVLVGCVLLALAIELLFSPHLLGSRTSHLDVSSWSAGRQGTLAVHRVLEWLGHDVERHRSSYGTLPAADDSVLVRVLPRSGGRSDGARQVDEQQIRLLRQWVEAGGRLVTTAPPMPTVELLGYRVPGDADDELPDDPVLESLVPDRPDWSWTEVSSSMRGRGVLADHRSELADLGADARALMPALVRETQPRTNAPDAGTRGSRAEDARPRLPLFDEEVPGWDVVLENGGRPCAAVSELGEGEVWLVPAGALFCNAAIGRWNTAPAVVALLEGACGRDRRTIYFDEFAHGFDIRRGPWWYVRHGPLAYPFVGVVLVLLVLAWRGAIRLGPPTPVRARRRRALEEYVTSLADLARRKGDFARAAACLLEAARLRTPTIDHHLAEGPQPSRCRDAAALRAFDRDLRHAAARAAERNES